MIISYNNVFFNSLTEHMFQAKMTRIMVKKGKNIITI